MVPSSSVAFSREISGQASLPRATAARNDALTLAASSTPAGTRWVMQVDQERLFALGRMLEELDQIGGLLLR